MTLKPQLAAADESQHTAASRSAAAVDLDTFVINLCSSTTPMALAHPDTPELKRFKFFVSRRLEDGRERFRLHMGHFESLEEAEDWLSVVRDVYPGAWAGEAPGKRLRARKAAAAHAAAPDAPSASPDRATAEIKLPTPPIPATAPSAAPAESSLSAVVAPRIAAPAPPPQKAAVSITAAAPPAPPKKAAIAAPAVAPLAPPEKAAMAPAAAPATAPTLSRHLKDSVASAPPAPTRAPVAPLSNVREVLASLDERDAKPAAAATAAHAATHAPHASQSLTDTQVMQILETRRTEKSPPSVAREVPSGIPMLRPDDTGTRRALKDAVRDNAQVSFAVQLQWAAQPLALDKVPPLAIFSAYTLYTVEGSREGRTWYGLRLGFFSDASAAKQVAHYVRSEFSSVAVVPVSHGERDRAARKEHTTAAASFAQAAPAPAKDEILLFDAAGAEPPRVSLKHRAGATTASATARAAAARSKKLRAEATVAEIKAEIKVEHTLEQTLEILGAGALEIDNGRSEFINASGMHRQLEVRKNSPFQRLLARLTERVRKG